jgi:ABC-type branched-subunit amino acid transport system substrate-binding protein
MEGRYALLVGVSQYGVGFEPLPGSEKDLEQMEQVLGNPEMGDFEVERLLNPEPQRLREKIEEFFRNRSRDDVLLFYFSGHGALDSNTGSQLYLSACGTWKDSQQQLMTSSAVAATVLTGHIAESKSQQKVVILDCCFSGAVANLLYNHKGDSNAINLEPLKAKGSVILASCEAYELSYQARESTAEDLAPSLYTRYLVKGIWTGAARKGSGEWILAEELHEYAKQGFQLEQQASMQPKIIALEEGYKIRVAKTSRDIKSEFSEIVTRHLKEHDGQIEGADGNIEELTQMFFEIESKRLGLSLDDAKAIIDEQRIPYVVREEKRGRYEAAYVVALGKGMSQKARDTLIKIQNGLSLRDEDVLAIEAKYTTSPPPEDPVPPPVNPPPDIIGSGGSGGTEIITEDPISQKPVTPPSQTGLPELPLLPIPDPPQQAWWKDRWRIIFGLLVLVAGIPVSLQLCKPSPAPEIEVATSPDAKLQPAKALISVGDNQDLYGSRSSKLSQEFRDREADGIKAFRDKDYEEARDIFAKLRSDARRVKDDPNETQDARDIASNTLKDPEILIFQNNAQARLNSSQPNGKPVLTIAAAVPVSGTKEEELIDYGQQMLFGVAQAQQKAIADDSINLEVIIANDLNNPAQAEALAQELVKPIVGSDGISRSILAVIGHYGSTVTCAALKTYSEARLAVISPTSTHPDLRKNCDGNTFFRTTSSISIEIKTLVNYLVTKNPIPVPKVAIFYNSKEPSIDQRQAVSSYSKTMSESLKQALKDQKIFTFEPIDLSAEDFDAQKALDRVREANVLAIFPDGKVGDDKAVQRATEVIKADGGQRLILGANTLAEQGSITAGDAKQVTDQAPGIGFLVAVDWFAECGSNPVFIKDGGSLWGGSPTRIFALSSEATQAIALRLSQGKTTKESILGDLSNGDALRSNVFREKMISFEPNGDRREIASRILITPFLQDNQKKFTLAPGQSCPNP